MKKSLLMLALLVGVMSARAQKFRGLDKSPMDMAYYPDDFAHDRKFAPQKVGDKAYIRLTYTRTAKKERAIFGKLVPYNKVWRIGTNEAPELKFYQDVTIQGQKVKAGAYTLFLLPSENEWTIILNTDLDVWGAYSYNDAKDILKVKVTPKTVEEVIENLSIQFVKKSDNEVLMQLGWDKTVIELPISL